MSRSLLPALLLVLLVFGALHLSPSSVLAQTPQPSASALLEDPAEPREVRGASGRSVFPTRSRPLAAEVPVRTCSFSEPVCVHAGANVRDVSITHVLLAAERFYRVTSALKLPRPLPDGFLGGDGRYDIYLVADPGPYLTIADDLPPGSFWDQTSAFTVMSPPLPPFACDSESLVARALARAAVFRVDAGIEDAAMGIAESYVADIVTDCTMATLAAVDDFQRFPEKTLGFRHADEAAGALLFGRFLDDTYGLGIPGSVLFSLLSVAAQHADPKLTHFANEPDFFDSLRSNARARGKPIDDLWLEFAIQRAFVGSRSDDGHLVDVNKYGDLGRVRFEWTVPLASLPRRLAPMRPIEALGATYIWVDLKDAPEDLNLAFVSDWEAGVLFHWTIVKVDAKGIEIGRITTAGIRGSVHTERSLLGLQGAAGLVIVGVNAGSIDRARPFDPDDGELARSYTVTLFRQ
jgi:hypothetical protein